MSALDDVRRAAQRAQNDYLTALAASLTNKSATPEGVWFGVDEHHGVLTLMPAAAELLLEHLSAPCEAAAS